MAQQLFIIEDESVMRDLCATFVRSVFPQMKILGSAADGDEALEAVRRLKPDFLLADIGLPGCDGLSILRAVRSELPQTRVLLFTGVVNEATMRAAVELGADGFVEKAEGVATIKEALEALIAGRHFFSPKIARHLLEMKFSGITVINS